MAIHCEFSHSIVDLSMVFVNVYQRVDPVFSGTHGLSFSHDQKTAKSGDLPMVSPRRAGNCTKRANFDGLDPDVSTIICMVGGLEYEFYFSSWECHHPN